MIEELKMFGQLVAQHTVAVEQLVAVGDRSKL